jgi:starvation-inducible outer membrane lipoprotein
VEALHLFTSNFGVAAYTAGRMVTVAGRVLGTHTDTVGERDTVYPLLACVEIYLWPQATLSEVYPSMW